jgi:antitoxin component of RelBE/YafQ-DinJ toxin-antitoxin module
MAASCILDAAAGCIPWAARVFAVTVTNGAGVLYPEPPADKVSLPNGVTMLSRRIVAEGKLPFEDYAVSTPLERTWAAVAESRAAIDRSEGRFESAQALFDALGPLPAKQAKLQK